MAKLKSSPAGSLNRGSSAPYSIVTPVIATLDDERFHFLGTGFFVGKAGHFVTCAHVVANLPQGELLQAFDLATKRYNQLEIIKPSSEYDLALCKSSIAPNVAWAFASEPTFGLGEEVSMLGFWHEPRGPEKLPFRVRLLSGNITGVPDDEVEQLELSFALHSGMSGSPIIWHAPMDDGTFKPMIVGCGFGVRESSVVQHTVYETPEYAERAARIVELGLAYSAKAIMSLFDNEDIEIELFGDVA